jgi:hypothetical protein
LFIMMDKAVAFAHRTVPLLDALSLGSRYAPLPALSFVVSYGRIATMRIEPLLSAVLFFRQVRATRLARPASLYVAGIGRERLHHFDLDLRHAFGPPRGSGSLKGSCRVGSEPAHFAPFLGCNGVFALR